MAGDKFRKQFIRLIILSWTIPPVFGLGFLLFINMFSFEQMGIILTTPLEPVFIISSLLIAIFYFDQYLKPVSRFLGEPEHNQQHEQQAVNKIRLFPLHYWSVFLIYIILAPSSVILAAERYTDFIAQPVDWFRIHLVALTVSIIVGLPIFFRIFDLFGLALGHIKLYRPYLSIKVKVFLIGALVPLLIDTMIVQYYWTRTGYFTAETFLVWLVLELLAVAGSLYFAHSFGQALIPLKAVSMATGSQSIKPENIVATSTDELGILTNDYADLLRDLQNQAEILSIGNEAFLYKGYENKLAHISNKVIELCEETLGSNIAFLILHNPEENNLVGIAQSGNSFNLDGFYKIPLNETSLAVSAFQNRQTIIIEDTHNNNHVSSHMVNRFNIGSAMATPLMAGDKTIGVIISAFHRRKRFFDVREIRFIESLAQEAALVINTQILYEQRDKAQRDSHKLNEYIHTMFDSTSEGILSINISMQCTFMNKAAINMLGYTPYELYDKDIYEILHYSDQHGNKISRNNYAIYRSITDGKNLYSDHELFKTKSGENFPVHFSSTPIREDGEIIGAIVVFRNVAEEKAIEKKLNYLATHDTLTGLINRHEFESRLSQLIEESHIDNTQHALCYLDLDQFKIVNDTCGHVAGDELLRQIATLLKSKIRQGDTLGRLGGDEFGLLFPHCVQNKVLELSEELRKTIEDFRFSWEGKNFSVGVSIGVVPISQTTESLHSALSAADAACYIAKDSGRNRIHVYHDEDTELAQHYGEMHWVNKINTALEKNNFVLYFQPISPINDTNNLHSFIEILVRINIDDSLVPPGAFIPAAERYNLMPLIDKWVLKNTFSWLKKHSQQVKNLLTCSINLSGASIGDRNFLSFIIDQLESGQVPTNKICFEITETTAVANLTQALHFIQELKNRGCRFALDDFGSGMSSFSYLKTLPVDYLKIDGNFVRNIADDAIDRTMVDAINQVGNAMNIHTIAEFVDNQQTLDELKGIGIEYVQGNGISKPQPLINYPADSDN
jgi:diguanylate cyclase (GGDEF)-like protein/PAS domain S-box-containing protein